jgi:hypothetical protein
MHKWSQRPGLASSARRSAVAIVSRSAAPCRVRDNFSNAGRKARVNEPRGVTRRGAADVEQTAFGAVTAGTEKVNEETALVLVLAFVVAITLFAFGGATTGTIFRLPSRITTVDVELLAISKKVKIIFSLIT